MGGAHERVKRAEGQPQVPQRGEIGVVGVRVAQHGGVDATGRGAGEYVHTDLDVEDGCQPGVTGGDGSVRFVGPVTVRAGRKVDLGGDPAHPDGEARATGHDDREPYLLGGRVAHEWQE